MVKTVKYGLHILWSNYYEIENAFNRIMNKRKGQAINTFNKIKNILEYKKISIPLNLRSTWKVLFYITLSYGINQNLCHKW